MAGTAFAQATDPSNTFSDLSTEYDGGVANPTDGSTGNVLQQTLFAAYFWGVAHGGARATVVVSSEYPIYGSRILVPGNVDLVCSSYSPQTYTGGCRIFQTDRGNNTATGGSPLLMADFAYGVLADHTTWCTIADNPPKPGCTIINSAGASISGFTLYGGGATAGGADVGIRVAANNVHVQDTAITGFFGGPGIQDVVGENNSFDWNYGTNVDAWWCANPSQLTAQNLKASLLKQDGGSLGGMDLQMLDGEASHNQYSTGCGFERSFTESLEYPHLAAMNVGGAGNLIQANLLQVDEIGLLLTGGEHRIADNRVEYQGREAIRSYAYNSLFSDNRITSACLDPNLINLRPGSLDNGIPLYPGSPTHLHPGYLIMDPNGNIEQTRGAGTSDASPPDWAVQPGDSTVGDQITWINIGPWKPGLTDSTDSGPVPDLVNGLCYAVNDLGYGSSWSSNQISSDPGVDGWSYERGSFFLGDPSTVTGNRCDGDLPNAYGNGQCWWGGDPFANGGPPYLAPNGQSVTASGGGTAWVGDYSVLVLADNVSRHYNNFQGMARGQVFSITSSTVANVIDPWSTNGTGGSQHGHPSVQTCTGGPLVVTPGSYYQFYYDLTSPYLVTQMDCPSGSGAGASSGFASISPDNLNFASQIDGTTSSGQTVKLTNTGGTALSLSFAVSDDFAQTNTCAGPIAVGANCTISITFTPTAAGAHAGMLTISNNGSGSSQTVALSGVGTASGSSTTSTSPVAGIALSSAASSLGVSAQGGSATTTLTVAPQNGFAGTVTLQCQISSEDPAMQLATPTCSLSSPQILITNGIAATTTLVISTQTSTLAATKRQVIPYKRMPLAALSLLVLLPCRRLRRKWSIAYLSVMLAIGMIGCGYTPTPSPAGYKVLITAASGSQLVTSINISLKVQ